MAGAVTEWSEDWGGAFLVLGAAAAEGAAIGAGLDALFLGRTLIYRQAPRQVTLAPLVSRGIRAVQLGISF